MTPPKTKRDTASVGHSIPSSALKTSATGEAGGRKRHPCKPLPKEFQRDGFTLRQIARESDAAIYEQTWMGSHNPRVSYEVVRIRRREGFEIAGRSVEPAEVYPNSKAWGTDGFTLTNKDAAFAKLREICR